MKVNINRLFQVLVVCVSVSLSQLFYFIIHPPACPHMTHACGRLIITFTCYGPSVMADLQADGSWWSGFCRGRWSLSPESRWRMWICKNPPTHQCEALTRNPRNFPSHRNPHPLLPLWGDDSGQVVWERSQRQTDMSRRLHLRNTKRLLLRLKTQAAPQGATRAPPSPVHFLSSCPSN